MNCPECDQELIGPVLNTDAYACFNCQKMISKVTLGTAEHMIFKGTCSEIDKQLTEKYFPKEEANHEI
jgi:hypothetical protein